MYLIKYFCVMMYYPNNITTLFSLKGHFTLQHTLQAEIPTKEITVLRPRTYRILVLCTSILM